MTNFVSKSRARKGLFFLFAYLFIANNAIGQCGNPQPINQCRGNGGELYLSIDNAPGSNINWYTSETGEQLAPGNSEGVDVYVTPPLSQTTTFYAQFVGESALVGEIQQRSSVIWSGADIIDYDTDDKRCAISVTQATTLQRITVYVASNSPSGTVVIRLLNSDGTTVIDSKTFADVETGKQVLDNIGIDVPAGNYVLDAYGTEAYLEFEAWAEDSRDPDVDYSYPYVSDDGNVTLSNLATWKNLGYGPLYAITFGDALPEPCPRIAVEAAIDPSCEIPNSLPTIELYISEGAVYSNSMATFYANVDDCDSDISNVTFYVDGTNIGTADTYPYYVNWAPTGTGTFAVTATVTDSDNGSRTSVEKPLSVRSAPISGGGSGDGAFYTGQYRNLFTEILGKTQAEVDAKINTAYSAVMGSSSETGVYHDNGASAYILNEADNDVRTEGMSYGMMIAVQMDKPEVFEKLWNWASSNMWVKSGDWDGFFHWQVAPGGSIPAESNISNASDGEAYFVMALFMAAHRWGNQNYADAANSILKKVQSKNGGGNVYPLFHTTHKQICFVSKGTSYEHTDPSYHIPGFWKLWAEWADSNNDFWTETIGAARDHLYNAQSKSSAGLFPDYSTYSGDPYQGEYIHYDSREFVVDAWRCAMNIGMDYHWFKEDSRQVDMMTKYLNFFNSQRSGGSYYGSYKLDGSPSTADRYTGQIGLIACNAVAAYCVDDQTITKQFVQDLWNGSPMTGSYRYYHNMLYLLGMLHTAGYMKIWFPNGTSSPDGGSGSTQEPATVSASVIAGGSTTICETNELVLVANAGSGYTYQWKKNDNNITGATNQHLAVTDNGDYSVAITANGESAVSNVITITLQNKPAAPSVATQQPLVKGSETVALTAEGTNLLWYGAQICGIGSAIAPLPSTAEVGETSYFVSQTVDGCESDRTQIIVQVEELNNETILEINSGWNLVSVGIQIDDIAIPSIFPCADIVKNDIAFYKSDYPDFLNSLSEITLGDGYLVHAQTNCTVSLQGASIVPEPKMLKKGWNVIGYPLTQDQTIETALQSIIESVVSIKNFDAFWDPNGGFSNSLTQLKLGEAYYIEVSQDCTLQW